MAKLSQLDRAIANLEAERAVLDAAIAKLKAQREAKPPKARTSKVTPIASVHPA